jgi:hypothetical protein
VRVLLAILSFPLPRSPFRMHALPCFFLFFRCSFALLPRIQCDFNLNPFSPQLDPT